MEANKTSESLWNCDYTIISFFWLYGERNAGGWSAAQE